MSYRISLLDKSPVAATETASDALQRTLYLAKQAEAWGYHRFWIAEHHNSPHLASPSPELVIAWILGQTRHIRVGSGGVMLQHYSPYKVAENFNLLASLAPGRIDLGVGKAPGGLPLATRALQQGLHQQEKGSFADQLAQLDNWLSLPVADEGDDALQATPIPPHVADRFLLGASNESALLAAQLGWNFVFAAHLNGDKSLMREVITTWRDHSQRDTLVAVQVIVAESEAEASELTAQVEIWGVELENGQRVTVASEAQAQAFARQAGSPARLIEQRTRSLIKGTPATVHAELSALQQEFGIDEFIIDTPIAEGAARIASLHLLAEGIASYATENESA
ncbi:LLM class flavin-dependent oxidoreductase [Serratia fonticola]|uniref:LLM class flavin-dependent oxidoreductase n=1 Tax=Serratia fonticola TaxID=47917 RepID=UPI003AB0AFE1